MALDNEQAWMINPRTSATRRRTRKKGRKVMARRKGKMPAGLARYWAGKRKKTSTRKRRRRTSTKRTVTRKRRRTAVMSNPRRRSRRRSHAPRAHRRRGYRRNPGIGSLIPSTGFLKEVAFVGAGYYGTRVAYNFVGPMIGIGGDLPRLAIKSVLAFSVSYIGGMLLGSGVRNATTLLIASRGRSPPIPIIGPTKLYATRVP